MAKLHGLPGVFDPNRAKITLDTIKKGCAKVSEYGPIIFTDANGTAPDYDPGYTPKGIFLSEAIMLAGTYSYSGEREFGLNIACRLMDNMAKQGILWDVPCFIDGRNGVAFNGHDYSQFGVLWTLPATLENVDLTGPSKPGGLVDRIIKAGKE